MKRIFKSQMALGLCFVFLVNTIGSMRPAAAAPLLGLPEPGVMLSLSEAYTPAVIKGLTLDAKNPFAFNFIVDLGNSSLPLEGRAREGVIKTESTKLIKYFLAALTIPEKDLWVNLSPYEKDRLLPQNLGQTEMGRDMLAQDYLLKQLTASLIYPEKELGKAFWDKVYAKAQQLYGSTTQVPVNTFNKVWIVADKADVFERGQTAFIVDAHLKVMLEEDYLAQNKQTNKQTNPSLALSRPQDQSASQIVREIILPEIEKEVNEGKNFAPLRQMFYSMILATWFKKALKQGLVAQLYADQGKTKVGVNQANPALNEEIYERYLQAYKKGVFNYIKEDIDAVSHEVIPKKYFSGGLNPHIADVLRESRAMTPEQVKGAANSDYASVSIALKMEDVVSQAMTTEQKLTFSGERPAQGVFNQKVFLELQRVQPDVLKRIEKLVTRFPDSNVSKEPWDQLHDGIFGYNREKRTVRIKLKKELIIDGEAVNEIHIQGVLFTQKGYRQQDKYLFDIKGGIADKIRGVEFDKDGRVIYTPYYFTLLGGQSEKAKGKYYNSLRLATEGVMRGPIALGYLIYDNLHMLDRKEEKLGVFIYAQRKNAPERALKLVFEDGAPVAKLFEQYGRALRESYNLQEDPSLANVTLDSTGKQRPIYHDLGEVNFRRDLTPQQAFAHRFDVFMSGFHRALEFMRYDERSHVMAHLEFTSQFAYIHYFNGFFHDRLQTKGFSIGRGRIASSLKNANFNEELTDLIRRYITLEKFGGVDLTVEEGTRQKTEEVMPVHWRSLVPFLPLLYEIEQTEYRYQPNYVNLAIAKAYDNIQSGASIEQESLELLHQLLLLGTNEDLQNIKTAIDILKASNIPLYSNMIALLGKYVGNRKGLYEAIQTKLPDLNIEPDDIRKILKRSKQQLSASKLKAISPPALSFEYFKKEEGQKISKLIEFVESLKPGGEIWEQRLSPQFKLPLDVVQEVLRRPKSGMVEVEGKHGAWKQKDQDEDQAMTTRQAIANSAPIATTSSDEFLLGFDPVPITYEKALFLMKEILKLKLDRAKGAIAFNKKGEIIFVVNVDLERKRFREQLIGSERRPLAHKNLLKDTEFEPLKEGMTSPLINIDFNYNKERGMFSGVTITPTELSPTSFSDALLSFWSLPKRKGFPKNILERPQYISLMRNQIIQTARLIRQAFKEIGEERSDSLTVVTSDIHFEESRCQLQELADMPLDKAMLPKTDKTGGIDFNANQMNMNVSKEGNGVGVDVDPALVEQIRQNGFEGFVPVIINVQPIKDIQLLLGIK